MTSEAELMNADLKILDDRALDILFRQARTYNSWQNKEVSDVLIQSVYDLMRWGPTSANCSPARFVFVKTEEAKERLKPHLDKGNVDKTMSAPVCVLIGQDMEFYEKLPELYPHGNARSWFAGNEDKIQETADRNAVLQGAYLMLAARSLGLDCGPMSGFNAQTLSEEFFAGTNIEANFICNLGYGTEEGLHPRGPRLDFDDACSIV
jgi:3-hydroxypropanoate dehydrogenase